MLEAEAASSTTNRILILYTVNSSSIPLPRKERDIIRTLSTMQVYTTVGIILPCECSIDESVSVSNVQGQIKHLPARLL